MLVKHPYCLEFDDSITEIIFDNYFNLSVNDIKWPQNLKRLVFGLFYNPNLATK